MTTTTEEEESNPMKKRTHGTAMIMYGLENKLLSIDIQLRCQILLDRVQQFKEWFAEEMEASCSIFHCCNENIGEAKTFLEEMNVKIGSVTQIRYKKRDEGQAVVEKLNQVASWARNKMATLMHDMKRKNCLQKCEC